MAHGEDKLPASTSASSSTGTAEPRVGLPPGSCATHGAHTMLSRLGSRSYSVDTSFHAADAASRRSSRTHAANPQPPPAPCTLQ